jgi:acyl-CoA synthetase (AMP-forming)/AMP-acid ligase II
MGELLVDQLRTMAGAHPDAIAYVDLDTGDTITFAEWEQQSNRLARGLVALGAGKGDRVALHLPGTRLFQWMITYAAIHKAGAVAVPTNTRLTPSELRTILAHAEVTGAITCDELLPSLADVRSLPSLRFTVNVDGATDDTTPVHDVLARDGSPFQVPVDEGDLADIMYTSGTTGLPKGVAVRHRNVAMIPNSEPAWSGQCWMHSSPLFTFAGIGFIYNPMKMGMGGTYQASFDAGRWLTYVETVRPTMCFIVPAMAQLIINHERFADADLSSLSLLSIGSAPLAPETLLVLLEKLPDASVSNSYGMTEAGPAYCVTPKAEAGRRLGSVGIPMPPMEIRIVDPDGTVDPDKAVDRPLREHGEVLVRNKGREREYYNDPDATARTWSADGWLRTGDIGYLDEDGYLYLCGRMKEVIIRGGNNVYATDVEAVLYEHPDVLEAAAVGVPHDVLGEDVGAFVVAKPGASIDEDSLIDFCRERLADYKVPRHVAFIDELPRNATGKVLKNRLKEHEWHSTS